MRTHRFSTYAHKILIDGYFVKIDYSDIKAKKRTKHRQYTLKELSGVPSREFAKGFFGFNLQT
ncbi:MAG: hypothetical protein PUK80_01225 [Firmicutes bacterium]|nr:hypothetical protein [Bacillota bacterium]